MKSNSYKAAALFSGVAVFLCCHHLAAANSIWLQSDLYGYSEPVPIDQMINGWKQQGDGQYAQGKARLSIGATITPKASGFGARFSEWSFGIQKRWDYHLTFTKDTARFYSLLENQQLSQGRYPLDLEANSLTSKVFFLENFIPLSSGSFLQFRLNIVKPEAVQWGSLKGVGEVLPNGDYSFEYDLDYRYSRDVLLERNAESLSGWGHSVDLSYGIQITPNISAEMWIEDGLYRVYWQEIDQSKGCLFRNRSQLEVCDQNYVSDSQVSGVQTLPMEYGGTLKWQVNNHLATNVSAWEWGEDTGLELGLQYGVFSGFIDVLHESVGFDAKSDVIHFSLGLDDTSVGNARYWRWTLGLTWPLQ